MGKLQDHDIKCQQPEETSETAFNQGKRKSTYVKVHMYNYYLIPRRYGGKWLTFHKFLSQW